MSLISISSYFQFHSFILMPDRIQNSFHSICFILKLEMILHVSDKYINYAWQTLYLSNVNWKKIAMQAVLDSITIQELGTLMSETTFSLIVNDGFTVVELGLAQQEHALYIAGKVFLLGF